MTPLTPSQRLSLAVPRTARARPTISRPCSPTSSCSVATGCAARTPASWAACPLPRPQRHGHRHPQGQDAGGKLKRNFGMPSPEGYRKALRLMRQAEKFGRPVLTFIDTPGAYPGLEAEARARARPLPGTFWR